MPDPARASAERLGVFGGTFDPPHLGHLILAETAADCLALHRVLFVPAADPPHKHASAIRASAEHRLAMTALAIADNARFALSRVDMDRPGPHYTVDMLRLLEEQHPGAELFLLLGSDSLRDLPAWSRPAELLTLARLGVMQRPGAVPDLDALERLLPGLRERLHWIPAPPLDLASSAIADLIAAGRSVRYLVPDRVLEYITAHGLYRG
ncbi:MAG: putative nicotinate-nucleotide adenylyltransferase [Anaerolineae bacterium]|nr:MAG: putative nicotinate-nucleotide adenylyltransferase [Anaerolineae bacterium]